MACRRETSHLFVAWVESLLLTIICLSIASGIGLFGVTGLAAWAFIVQASTFAPTLIVHMVFFTSEKRHEIRGDNALADGRVGRLDVAYVTTVSNAYCGVLSTVLLYVLSMYLQAIHFGSTIPDDQSWRVRGPDAFITTKRLDWSQVTRAFATPCLPTPKP